MVGGITLRGLLTKLTAFAISASAVAPASAAAAPVDELRELEDDRKIDIGHLDPHNAAIALGRGLALALGELRPLAATQLAATWSLSRDPLRRLALGLALEWTFPLVGDGLVLEHLTQDGDPAIRAAAARAVWVRRGTAEPVAPAWSDLLARLVDDPDPQVRAIAMAAHAD
jgi:hypothetical protein